jgi:hypothetical protein
MKMEIFCEEACSFTALQTFANMLVNTNRVNTNRAASHFCKSLAYSHPRHRWMRKGASNKGMAWHLDEEWVLLIEM